jgi:hypothetical protein
MSTPSDDEVKRWCECDRKIPYLEEGVAQDKVEELGSDRLHVYSCSYGEHFHVGHRPKRRRSAAYFRSKHRKKWLEAHKEGYCDD